MTLRVEFRAVLHVTICKMSSSGSWSILWITAAKLSDVQPTGHYYQDGDWHDHVVLSCTSALSPNPRG